MHMPLIVKGAETTMGSRSAHSLKRLSVTVPSTGMGAAIGVNDRLPGPPGNGRVRIIAGATPCRVRR